MTDASPPLLRVERLTKHYPVTRGVLGRVVGHVRAVDGVSFDVGVSETLGLVGESGCGKTTVGRSLLRLIEPTSGTVTFDGTDVLSARKDELARLRRHLQIVFQDPVSSLNPRKRVVDIVGEALEVHGLASGAALDERVRELLGRVGLPPAWMNRYPHEFSGGQRQRIGIARALALSPKLIVCDEAVSALDVSIQAQVVNLLIGLQRDMGLSYLFIAHDLSVVRHVSHRVAVMYLGQIVEIGPTRRLFRAPGHPYTRALLSAIPVPRPGRTGLRVVLEGDVPTPLNPPGGCRFHTRCPAAFDRCPREEPTSFQVESEHAVKCWHAEGLEGDPDWHRVLVERAEAAERMRRHATAGAQPFESFEASAYPERKRSPGDDHDDADAADSHPGGAIAVAALLAGLLATFTGHFVLGPAVLLMTYAVALRRRMPSPPFADAVTAVSLLLLGAAGGVAARASDRGTAERDVAALCREVEARARVTGRLPESLDDLGYRLYPLFEGGKAFDPWGNRYVYALISGEKPGFALGSAGPDGVPGTGDDIGRIPKTR